MPTFHTEGEHELLYSKANWVLTDLPDGNLYVGGGGARSATAANVPWIDARAYREVQVWAWLAGLTGGSTPAIEVNLEHGLNDDASLTFLGATTSGIAAAGGSCVCVAGGGLLYNSLAGAGFGSAGAISPFCPPFFRMRLNVSGSAEGLTAPGFRLYAYGVR